MIMRYYFCNPENCFKSMLRHYFQNWKFDFCSIGFCLFDFKLNVCHVAFLMKKFYDNYINNDYLGK